MKKLYGTVGLRERTQGKTVLEGVQISLEKVEFMPLNDREVLWVDQAGLGLQLQKVLFWKCEVGEGGE